MYRPHNAFAFRMAATVAAAATTSTLLSAVISLSEPERSRLMAAGAARQMASRSDLLLMAQSTHALPTATTATTKAIEATEATTR